MELFWMLVAIFAVVIIIFSMRGGWAKTEITDKEAIFADEAKQKMLGIINKHLPTLAIRQQQLVTTDAYGVIDVSAFNAEIDYFIEKVLWADEDVKSYLGGVDTGNLKQPWLQ